VNNTAIFNNYLNFVLHFQLSGKTVGKWNCVTAVYASQVRTINSVLRDALNHGSFALR